MYEIKAYYRMDLHEDHNDQCSWGEVELQGASARFSDTGLKTVGPLRQLGPLHAAAGMTVGPTL